MLHILVYSVAAEMQIIKYTDEGKGAFDVQFDHKSLSRDGLGTFIQIEIDGQKYDFQPTANWMKDLVMADFNIFVDNNNPNVGYFTLRLECRYFGGRNVRVVMKSDIKIGDNDNRATKVSDNFYYFDDETANIPKYLFDISSTADYIGPSKFSYGLVDDESIDKYYDRNDRPDTISGDLYVSYAWDMTELLYKNPIVYGIKFKFKNNPVLTMTFPDKHLFNNKDYLTVVFNSLGSSIMWHCLFNDRGFDHGTLSWHSISHDLEVNTNDLTFYLNNTVNPMKFTFYLEDDGLRSNVINFTFWVRNTPIITSAWFKQTKVYPGHKIQLSITIEDRDFGEILYIFAKATNKDAVIVKTYQTNGYPNTIETNFTYEDLGEFGQKEFKVWVSNTSSSTENSDDGLYVKSTIKTLYIEYAELPKLDINYPVKTTYQHGEKINLTGKINSTGITMKFRIDTDTLNVSRSFMIDDFNFDLDIPETTKFGEHTLHVIIVDSNNYEAIDDAKFKFTYNSTAPVFKDVKLEQETVKAGSIVKICGEVKDVDVGSSVIITASYGENKQNQTTVESNGDFQKFEIEIETEDSNSNKTIEIEVQATDNITITILDSKLKLNVIPTPKPTETPGISNNNTTFNSAAIPTKDAAQNSGKLTNKQKVAIGVVIPIILLAVAGAAIGYFIIKKNKNSEESDDASAEENNDASAEENNDVSAEV